MADRDLCFVPATRPVRPFRTRKASALGIRSGPPVGLQIVGRRRQEASVLRAAAAFEAAHPWADSIRPVVPARA